MGWIDGGVGFDWVIGGVVFGWVTGGVRFGWITGGIGFAWVTGGVGFGWVTRGPESAEPEPEAILATDVECCDGTEIKTASTVSK